ncbi:hypothetical protein B2J93_320 [Marssonina coronariae]|uniref:Uncharacterized protein n=1 Tax=Diplocarpon coronariae TaxID=2795749 RepID=A0A218Z008_9HELO|nr:hypothetical protein B2J93_320 [Marssonina coronariae]
MSLMIPVPAYRRQPSTVDREKGLECDAAAKSPHKKYVRCHMAQLTAGHSVTVPSPLLLLGSGVTSEAFFEGRWPEKGWQREGHAGQVLQTTMGLELPLQGAGFGE